LSSNTPTKIRLKLHFRLLLLLIIINRTVGFSNSSIIPSSIIEPAFSLQDTVSVKDSAKVSKKKSSIDNPIMSNADDSTIYSLDGKTAFLYGNAFVSYQNMELKARYIEFDMEKKQVFASGLPDSTGKIVGRPVFKEGNQTYEMDVIHYNFDTKRARISGVVTEQSGGYMHSEVTKKMEDNVVNMMNGKYTTCDLDHPHFYLAITKGKMIPEKKIISGPAYIVIEDVPLPLFIPFGFFPNTRSRASGIIIPEYGEESNRGLFLRGGGFYFGMGDYLDEKITADFYSRGSWGIRSQTNYKLRYKFSGSLHLEASTIVTSEKGLSDYQKENTYWIRWNHSQDAKAHPNSTFQANVNFGSSNHNRFNARDLNNVLANTFNSSISYSKVWAGTPFSMTSSLNHSQNNIDSTVNIGFPKISFNMAKIYPFKRKNAIGAPVWYEKIGFSLATTLDNRVNVKENDLFKKSVVDSMQNGMKHDIPLSTSFNILKFITLSPGTNYSEFWYLKTIDKTWNPITKTVETDTINGFKRGYQYNAAVSLSTKIYGTFQYKKTSKIQAIRHVLTPSVSLSYRPDFSAEHFGFYKTVQTDSTGKNFQTYSIFEKGIYGGPGGGKSGVLSFSLSNLIEMKVLAPNDTVNPVKKVKILEGFNINSSYNLLADSMNWSDISVSGRTNLFNKININFSGVFSPYAIDAKGRLINKYEFNSTGKFARFVRGNLGFDFSLNSSKGTPGGDKGSRQSGIPTSENPLGTSPDGSFFGESMGTQYGMDYVDFDVPWNIRFSYNLSYSKPGYESSLIQTLSFSGDLSLTPKWKIGFSSGYDLKNKKLTTSSVNFFRDLHCWEMRMTVVPIGFYKSFSFQINVKSAILQDLKYTKRDHYLDNL